MFYKTTPAKEEQIKKWKAAIEKLEAQIEKLKNDKTLSVAERKKKIERRLEIIKDYQFAIKQAQQYLDARAQKDRELYAMFIKTK